MHLGTVEDMIYRRVQLQLAAALFLWQSANTRNCSELTEQNEYILKLQSNVDKIRHWLKLIHCVPPIFCKVI